MSMLTDMAPEMIHAIALSGYLTYDEVGALGMTCRAMAEVIIWDEYGRRLRRALVGVLPNLRAKRWECVWYALRRRWFGKRERAGYLWQQVVSLVWTGGLELESRSEMEEWEELVLVALEFEEAKRVVARLLARQEKAPNGLLMTTAASVGAERLVRWGVEGGWNVDVVLENGESPLYQAAKNGHVGVVEILLEEGGACADLMEAPRARVGWMRRRMSVLSKLYSPREVARKNGHEDVVKVFERHGDRRGGAK